MSKQKNLRELSKNGYVGEQNAENINIGSFQRIADSLENISTNNITLVNQNVRLKIEVASLEKSISNYKGQITRLKNKLKTNA